MRDSAITGNSAGSGGGIHIQALAGTSTIQNSTVSGNFSTNNEVGGGGGIRAAIYTGASFEILDSTVSGNSASIDGGGLLASAPLGASLTLENSEFSGNSAGFRGGGISVQTYLGATTTIRSCTVSGNSAVDGADNGGGGGIYSRNFGTVTIQGSTLLGNSAKFDGGAIDSHNITTGTTTIENCTLSGNQSDGDGGGVWSYNYNGGALEIQNCTVTANIADADSSGAGSGGGIHSSSGSITLQDAILAGNTDNSGTAPDVVGSIAAAYSLVGNNFGSALVEAPVGSPDANGNLIGGPIHGTIDPLIGALADNGGPTQTHALLAGSPAIDAGDPAFVAPPDFDQRGAPHARVRNGGVGGLRVDVGAFEFRAFLPGDYDHDDDVDADDYGVWKQNFGSTSNLFADGNGNGRVDAADYTV